MMVQQKSDIDFDNDAFLHDAFANIAQHGWKQFSPQIICEKSEHKCPHYLESKTDFLTFFEDTISKKLYLTSLDLLQGDETPREKLFDILMERFDLMRPYKKGLKRVIYALPQSPKALLKTVPSFRNLMIDLLTLANISHTGITGEIKLIGLSYIYLKTCRVWLEDETTDSSKTMAELDKNLGFADQVAASLFKD